MTKLLLVMVAAGALLLPPAAGARDWKPGFGALMQAQGEPMKKGPGPLQRGDRDKRGQHDKRYHGRLTEEQRRELHRDLERANREIYRR